MTGDILMFFDEESTEDVTTTEEASTEATEGTEEASTEEAPAEGGEASM